uniref:Secreted protein n=1 Tax=Strongyloides venezuelensis TaxID=75913 RepID=A0A0K0FCQ2_STRVS
MTCFVVIITFCVYSLNCVPVAPLIPTFILCDKEISAIFELTNGSGMRQLDDFKSSHIVLNNSLSLI